MEYLQSVLADPLVANQVEMSLLHHGFAEVGISFNQSSPGYPDGWEGTMEYCRTNRVLLQAWSPLAQGVQTGQEESFKIMDRALELGINFFDTADVYGRGGEQGDTEEILGRWFAQGGGRRDAVVLATKVFNPVKRKANLAEPNTDGRSLSAYHPQALRRQSETAPERSHRPLPDAPHRPRLPLGRDLASL